MKILQLLAGNAHGGAETAFVDTCLALAEAGEQIEVATRPNALRVGRLEKAGLKVHQLPFGGMVDFYTPSRLRKIIADFEPHIVQSWMSRATQKLPAWRGRPQDKPYRVVARLGGYYKIKHYKKADYFMTITPDIQRYLQENGIAAERIRHVNNFADTEEVSRPVNRADLQTPADAPVLLALGRLHEAKAFDTLLAALKDVAGAYLWIAGEGPLRQNLETLTAELGLTDRVRFLGWRDDRAALFQAADICVFSSRHEPFGTVFVQAWAQRTPLITTAAQGPSQYVRDGEDALLVPIDEPAALSAAIRKMLEAPDFAEKLAARGYQRYLNEFTKEKTVQSYLSFFSGILEKEGLITSA